MVMHGDSMQESTHHCLAHWVVSPTTASSRCLGFSVPNIQQHISNHHQQPSPATHQQNINSTSTTISNTSAKHQQHINNHHQQPSATISNHQQPSATISNHQQSKQKHSINSPHKDNPWCVVCVFVCLCCLCVCLKKRVTTEEKSRRRRKKEKERFSGTQHTQNEFVHDRNHINNPKHTNS